MCLLVRYLAKEQRQDVVLEFGKALWGRQKQFRETVAKLLDNRHSKVKGVITEKFLVLEDSRSASLNDAFKRAEAYIDLGGDIAVFDAFKGLDHLSME
jgi:hypothetical protein